MQNGGVNNNYSLKMVLGLANDTTTILPSPIVLVNRPRKYNCQREIEASSSKKFKFMFVANVCKCSLSFVSFVQLKAKSSYRLTGSFFMNNECHV